MIPLAALIFYSLHVFSDPPPPQTHMFHPATAPYHLPLSGQLWLASAHSLFPPSPPFFSPCLYLFFHRSFHFTVMSPPFSSPFCPYPPAINLPTLTFFSSHFFLPFLRPPSLHLALPLLLKSHSLHLALLFPPMTFHFIHYLVILPYVTSSPEQINSTDLEPLAQRHTFTMTSI